MERERYPGERRGLGRFLADLLPVVEARLGCDTLLFHRVRKALQVGDLSGLRDARRMFNAQSRDVKQVLSAAMCVEREQRDQEPAESAHASGLTAGAAPARERRASNLFICFDGEEEPFHTRLAAKVEQRGEKGDVRVAIRPGTLPNEAAKRLRAMAAAIEADRRILSERHWLDAAAGTRERPRERH